MTLVTGKVYKQTSSIFYRNDSTNRGAKALAVAASNGKCDVISVLLKHGGDINASLGTS